MSDSYGEKSVSVKTDWDRIFVYAGIVRFSERLAEASKSRLSYTKIAALSDLSEKVVRNYIKAETYPSLDRLVRLASALGVPPEWLAFGINRQNMVQKENKNSDKNADDVSTEAQQLMNVWQALEIDERNTLLKLLARNGARLLASLTDENTVELLDLKGVRRQAALMLADLPESRVREILAAVEDSAGGATITDHSASA